MPHNGYYFVTIVKGEKPWVEELNEAFDLVFPDQPNQHKQAHANSKEVATITITSSEVIPWQKIKLFRYIVAINDRVEYLYDASNCPYSQSALETSGLTPTPIKPVHVLCAILSTDFSFDFGNKRYKDLGDKIGALLEAYTHDSSKSNFSGMSMSGKRIGFYIEFLQSVPLEFRELLSHLIYQSQVTVLSLYEN